MDSSLESLLEAYDASKPLEEASTIPSAWYTDHRIYNLELKAVFGRTWQMAARLDQLAQPGQYVTTEIAGEPVVIVQSEDGSLRAFFNVCRHHAAAVATQPEGQASVLRCPYHGWTYALDGRLKAAPEFESVCHFDKSLYGLAPIRVATWENFVFVNLSLESESLEQHLGNLSAQVKALNLKSLHFFERRTYTLNCNWKVFIDNYLDGGYHVPHIHKGLNGVLEYSKYTIENQDRFCLQSSPIQANDKDLDTSALRSGDKAYYYWLHPNFMINAYQGTMDTNLVVPLAVDRTLVVFDFYFDQVSPTSEERNRKSVRVGERVQEEDIAICESVQRGLKSQAYDVGRLSVRRESGEHLFHRLLSADLTTGLESFRQPLI